MPFRRKAGSKPGVARNTSGGRQFLPASPTKLPASHACDMGEPSPVACCHRQQDAKPV